MVLEETPVFRFKVVSPPQPSSHVQSRDQGQRTPGLRLPDVRGSGVDPKIHELDPGREGVRASPAPELLSNASSLRGS